MLSIADGYEKNAPNLCAILKTQYTEILVVHRLDKLTSGVILFAKNKSTHKLLNQQFLLRRVNKQYRAICFGFPLWDKTIISLPLRVNGDRQHRTIVDFTNGKPAQTHVEIIRKNSHHFIADIQPKSGYTHQIRAHLAAIGHPIIGDPLYNLLRERSANGKIGVPFVRAGLFLHAHRIEFADISDEIPPLQAILPEKFKNYFL